MEPMDFVLLGIKYFTAKQITDTGAQLKDVKIATIKAIDNLRIALNTPIKLIVNGITTGDHKAIQHRNGEAVDVIIGNGKDNDVDTIVSAAIAVGFKGIGCYWNGKIMSWHFDLRTKLTMWSGVKDKPGVGSWLYSPMIKDPRVK